MSEITTLFWDVGGVLLTNGWDTESRRRAVDRFGLEWEEFRERHVLVKEAFETGGLTLEEYLECTVFHRDRDFDQDAFREFMFRQSQAHEEVLEIVADLATGGGYLMATLNNESRELNEYRIDTFYLRDHFVAFFSSCYLGVKKPDAGIYRTVLRIMQRQPTECLFIDDRPLNVEEARKQDIQTIQYRDPPQLRRELEKKGIPV